MRRQTKPWTLAAVLLTSLAPLLAADPGIVSGRVLDPRDAPVAGATVHTAPSAPDPSPVKTDDSGLFRFAAPPAGPFRLRVEAPGLVAVERTLPPVPAETGLPPARLVLGRPLSVTVRGADGAPIGGATVVATPLATPPAAGWHAAAVSRRCDGQGRAGFAALPDEALRLEVHAAGHPPSVETVEPGRQRVEVTLAPGRSVRFAVTTADGTPAGGSTLQLADGSRLAKTGEDGRAEVVLPAAAATVRAVGPGGEPAEVRVPAGRSVVELRLAAGRHATGVVVGGDDGAPIAAAWVWEAGAPERAVRTDPRGRFAVPTEPFAASPPRLVAAAAGHRRTQVEAGGGATTIALPPATRLGGRLLDPAGRPVPGAAVTVAAAHRAAPDDERATWAWSADDGRFAIAGLAPGDEVWIRARHAAYVPHLQPLTVPAPGTAPTLRLTLEPAWRGVGRVVDADGEGVAGATVDLLPASVRNSATDLLTAGERRLTATTGAEGRFTVDGLAAGGVEAEVRAPGLAALHVSGIEVDPGRRGIADLGTFALEPAALLRGRVTSTDGTPLAGVEVTARRRGAGLPGTAGSVTARSGGDGAFVVDGLAGGESYRLRFTHPGHAPSTQTAVRVPAAAPLEVVLTPAAALAGHVLDDDGEPLADALVMASRRLDGGDARPAGMTKSDAEGRFRLDGLGAGRFRVAVRAAGFATAETDDLDLEAGDSRNDLEIELSRGGALVGTVRDAAGEPLAGVRLLAEAAEVRGLPLPIEATSDDDGRYRLAGLRPGHWALTVLHPEHRRLRRELEVGAGDQRLDLVLEAGAEVAGRVVDGGGEPVAGAEVRLLPSGAAAPTPVTTSTTGAFRFAAVPPGRHRLVARLHAKTAVLEVEVNGRPESELVLRLDAAATIAGRVLGLEAGWDGGEVTASAAGLPSRTTRIGHDGSYRLTGLPAGTWTVAVHLAPGGPSATQRVEVTAGATVRGVDLELVSP